MTEQILAIWMFQAMLCVFKKHFLLENMIYAFKQQFMHYAVIFVKNKNIQVGGFIVFFNKTYNKYFHQQMKQ